MFFREKVIFIDSLAVQNHFSGKTETLKSCHKTIGLDPHSVCLGTLKGFT